MKLFVISLSLLIGCSVMGETRIWTLKNGNTVEADFVSLIGGTVSLKTLNGKLLKVPGIQLTDEDRSYIDLQMPPSLDISFSKTTKQRVFPESLSELPSAQYMDCTAMVKQTSTQQYNHELQMEFFIIGEEKAGGKFIFLDYKKAPFRLTQGSKSIFQLSSRTIELIEFEMNGQLRGEVYTGYIIVITDSRGEIIAYKSTREDWMNYLDNLRKVPIGKVIDQEFNRCWPTRPKRFY